MKLQEFSYDLPPELIAQEPLAARDQARLMVVNRATGMISHDIFANLGNYLPPSSVVVLNDSKVIPARLFGKRATGGKVEIFLLKQLGDGVSFETLIRPLKRLKDDEKIFFNGGSIYAEIKDIKNRIVQFNVKMDSKQLDGIGHIPLPPYIKRRDVPADKEFYQTVYAQHEGSVAAPTAGLHFTKELLDGLQKAGHSVEKVTLHVNYATFNPVKEENITEHQMHFEDYAVSAETWKAIGAASPCPAAGGAKAGRPIVAVGTTSCRVLESVAQTGILKGSTNIFIYPGYEFKLTDILITNFHLPYSTLLMLVYAFTGRDLMRRAYEEAIHKRYRFFSYGDAMIIL